MTRDAFERLVAEAVRLIPARFRREMQNLALVVEDAPAAALLADMGIDPPDSLYGVYQGTPLPERQWADGNRLPDRITIYRRVLCASCNSDSEVVEQVRRTVIHEVGHHFGIGDARLRELGW